MQPIRVTYNQACELLSIKRNALRELTISDPTFPKAYKAGTTRQAPVYFDYAQLIEWHNNQIKSQTNAELEA
ncbi:transcriptional regulator [Acinetobacter calcoaceticus]|uniref:transcriptional regulator n=1 Tax=Acinetobacter calcoaceticus TaxID=471 RepID=UPI0005E597D7|nr:transcriptional regulator [Acinetobacter calcoaceticus]KJH62124.1 transcriptional regulator [Acinetobacter calcoaceticus]